MSAPLITVVLRGPNGEVTARKSSIRIGYPNACPCNSRVVVDGRWIRHSFGCPYPALNAVRRHVPPPATNTTPTATVECSCGDRTCRNDNNANY
ncbi:unnamed protein product [Caenorhabditis nigoni]|uniref:Uncharacterized protein n=1 Tax=Caenorhabditis nigoni TaxID=1611254 RepID=A0A2G5SY73_9PELO|nr:hypothetical protein B9Z55_025205 [Caenorhabditis nigoni]